MRHVIDFAAPPMLARRLRADIEAAFPDFRLSPPYIHFEMFEAARGYGRSGGDRAAMMVTAYPQLLNRVVEEGAPVASLAGLGLPPLRAELVRAGLAPPHPDVALIAAVPLVLAVDRRQAPEVEGWDDLRPLLEAGKTVAAPPDDTPLPYLLAAFLSRRWGMDMAAVRSMLDRRSSPLEINKRLASGDVAAGLLPPAFCRNARAGAVDLIWPKGGPLIAPIFAVIAPDAPDEARAVFRALFAPEMQRVFAELGGMLPVVDGVPGPMEVNGAGWDLQPTCWPVLLDVGRRMTRQLVRGSAEEATPCLAV